MKKINCLVADDEEIARSIIENYIGRLPNLTLAASCANGTDVYAALKTQPIDLLFLDIQMPQLTGIELLRTLKKTPPVIITTAYREFALEGYELNVIDYLLKPIPFERFLKAVDKFETANQPGIVTQAIQIIEPVSQPDPFIYVKADKKMVRILLKDILYIEGLKDYVKIQTADKSIITYQTIIYFEEKLSANYFIRLHRSYIISLQHITAYSASQVEIGKKIIPIGGSYAAKVMAALEK
jgi:DNA-binding LytR/AlgR family response regulator